MFGLPFLGSLLLIAMMVILVWFAVGTQRNIRKGNDLLRWLQGGLPTLGKRTRLKWLGSSAVQLNIVEPKDPFREAEVVAVLEPRDIGMLWALARARRRRDFVILRGRLDRSPRYELEAGDLRGWTGQDGLRKLDPEAWSNADWDDPNVRVLHEPGADVDAARTVWRMLAEASGGVWRLSIRRTPPHLEVHVLLPDTALTGADRLIEAFHGLARSVST
ncbi:MAG TPA: hypothetical protein VGL18_14290 [Actinomycetota bacterium]|jgi:hypothetical protein